jgi:hypothetical protein
MKLYLALCEPCSDVIPDKLRLAVDDVFVEEDEDVRGQRNKSGRLPLLRNQERDAGFTAVTLARLNLFLSVTRDVFRRVGVALRRKERVREPLSQNGFAVIVVVLDVVFVVLVVDVGAAIIWIKNISFLTSSWRK